MLDKAKADFLRRHGGAGGGQNPEDSNTKNPPFPVDDLLGWVKERFDIGWPENLTELFTKYRDRPNKNNLLYLLHESHGMASGVEKQSYKPSTVRYLSQDITHMWLTTAFGHPVRNLIADPPSVLSETGWERLVEKVQRVLQGLRDLADKDADVRDDGEWYRWRCEAIGAGSYIRQVLTSTLAETRLPNNDVTLWDQSYVAAALFKSAAAGTLLHKNSDNSDKGELDRGKVRWRLLTVGICTDHYEARAVQIGDWTGVRDDIDEFFESVCRLIEVDLALGSLVYRDSSVCVFSFPGERSDGSPTPADWVGGWESWLQHQVDDKAKQKNLETPPYCRLSPPTRSLVPIVVEQREARKKVAIPIHRSWVVPPENPSLKQGHVCPICLVRSNGSPGDKVKPCTVCEDRRYHRLDDWLNGKLGTDTIWLEEIADANDRIALLTLSLDVAPWIGGERVDSLRAQAIVEWRKFNPCLSTQESDPIDLHRPYVSLTDYVRRKLGEPFRKDDLVLSTLQVGYRKSRDWKTFYEAIVEDRAEAPSYDDCNNDKRARWIVHQLMRKLPSAGRVYRFWRQTEEFFVQLLDEFRQIASRNENRWRVRRLLLVPDDAVWPGQKGRLYDGLWGARPVSLVSAEGGFVTACNLARVMDPVDTCSVWTRHNSNTISLWDPDASPLNSRLPLLVVRDVKEPEHLGVYHPVIPLEVSPLRFRVLVPLEVASECVDLACHRWQEDFGRVLDRLPLRVGVVGFPSRTPFHSVLEMARIVEADLKGEGQQEGTEPESWRVHTCKIRDGMAAVSFQRRDGAQELWMVPVRLPDGRVDGFYPYMSVEDRRVHCPYDFQHPEGQVYRHVMELRPGDGVYLYPARIATVFLDTTARRFEQQEVHYLADWNKMRQVWRLLAETADSVTQLHRVRQELAHSEETWGVRKDPKALDIWLGFVRAVLSDVLQVKGAALEHLVDEARSGILLWAMDWHLRILKGKPTGGGKP